MSGEADTIRDALEEACTCSFIAPLDCAVHGSGALAALDVLVAENERYRNAIHQARRELWWFVERETGDGWGWEPDDVERICEVAMRIQDETLAAALAGGGDATETQR